MPVPRIRCHAAGADARGWAAKTGIWLLAALLLLHQVMPAAWAAPPPAAMTGSALGGVADAFLADSAICHSGGEKLQRPAELPPAGEPRSEGASHCKSCILFCAAASSWAAPVAVVAPPPPAAVAGAASCRPSPAQAASLALVLRPNPRAPPSA